jgi:hypothetical protein
MLKLSWYYKLAPSGCLRRHDDALFEVEFRIMMLQGICLKVKFVEFVIQILKKEAFGERSGGPSRGGLGWSVTMPTGLRPVA